MNGPDDAGTWVPKVDPRTRPLEEEDPLELVAQPAFGDPQQMLQCLLAEFLAMGWEPAALAGLFYDPRYPLLVELRRCVGQAQVERCLAELMSRGAQLRILEQIADEAEEDDGPQTLLQILPCPTAAGRGGDDRDGPHGGGSHHGTGL